MFSTESDHNISSRGIQSKNFSKRVYSGREVCIDINHMAFFGKEIFSSVFNIQKLFLQFDD